MSTKLGYERELIGISILKARQLFNEFSRQMTSFTSLDRNLQRFVWKGVPILFCYNSGRIKVRMRSVVFDTILE